MRATTTSDGWIFPDEKPKQDSAFPDSIEPYLLLSTQKQWDNFSDTEAYDFEKRLREFLRYLAATPKYRSAKARRFTYSMVYQRLYGHEPAHLTDSRSIVNRQILAYYSSRLIENTTIEERRCKRVFVLAYSRANKRPWSLRLRLEWYVENGEPVTQGKMRVINKTLEWGHARNPRTDRNMEARRERARERYRAKYNTPEYRDRLKNLHREQQ